MNNRGLIPAGVALAIVALSACGGGGAGGSKGTVPGPSTTPTPVPSTAPQVTPTPAAVGSYAFHIISLVAGVSTTSVGLFPVANPTLPAGQTLGAPAANAVITYPDGSSQIANANGFFQAAASSYVQSHAQVIETNPLSIPYVRVSDATGAAQPGGANVVAVSASVPSNRIVGLTVAPAGSEIFANGSVLLIAQGTSVDDLVATPGSSIHWSDTANGTFTQVGPDSTQQIFTPSANTNTTTVDTVVATMSAPGVAKPYSASAQVTILPTSQAATVSGTVSGSPLNASADFILDDSPHLFPSYNFLGLTDVNGNYSVTLPANQQFAAAILSPSNVSQSFIAAMINGANSYTSGNAGSSSAGVSLVPQTTSEDDSRDDASNAAPDPIVSVRDAWQAAMLLAPAPWWADSGVLGLVGGSTVTQAPAVVGSGLLADWCYQWTTSSGTASLTLVENTATSCASSSSSGNIAYVITPQGVAGTFSYVEYRSISGGYLLGTTLAPGQNAVLVATGQWTQTLNQTGGAISSDNATITQTLFGPTSQIATNGLSSATFTYAYTLSGSNATVTIGNLAWTDPMTSLPLGSASSIVLARTASASSCVGSAAPCYSATGTINRTYGVATGPVQVAYSLTDGLNGDGSSNIILALANAHSYTSLPIASALQRSAGSCVVCASDLGVLFDTDGSSQIGSYSVDAQQFVTYQLLGTSEAQGGAVGAPIGVRVFGL